MNNTLQPFKKVAAKVTRLLSTFSAFFKSDDPLTILPYRGYANAGKLFLKGRVLEDERIVDNKSKS